MADTIRFCLIGTGRAGRIHAGNLAEGIEGATLAGVCDTNPKNLASAAKDFSVKAQFPDYRQAMDSPELDAVVIVTPTFLHRDIACAAAEAGKHIFLEKPMALSVEECQQINEAVSAAGVCLQVGFMRRFDTRFRQAKKLVDSGALGRVMMVKSTGRGPGGPGAWMYDLSKSNGIVAEVNSHDIDSLHWFTGSCVARVYAEGQNFKSPDAVEQFPDFYDNVVAQARFEDDTLGVIDGTCPATYGYDARVEVLCEGGVVFVGDSGERGFGWIDADGRSYGQAVRSWRSLFKEAYRSEMSHFVESIHGQTEPEVTGEDGLEAVRVVEAINHSILAGQAVEVQREVTI